MAENKQATNVTEAPGEIEPSPGVDDLMAFYEGLEDIYWKASEYSAVFEENGLTTSHTNIPERGRV